MQNQNQNLFQEENSWFHCIGDIQDNPIQGTLSNAQTKILNLETNQQLFRNFSTESHAIQLHQNEEKALNSCKRQRESQQNELDYFTQNSSSADHKSKLSEGKDDSEQRGKHDYTAKQHIYSKNYRQRKKQKTKCIMEQNEYLRKKIQQLESRLREMQLQINRLKFMPEDKEYSIEQLNSQFMSKVTVIMEKNKENPVEFKSKYNPEDPFYGEFMETYAKHGFAGSKKMQIINYYYNQILEAILRDSERYFCLMCVNANSAHDIKGFPQYEIINNVFFDILQPNEDKLARLNFFQLNLHPMVNQLVDACKEFNAKFNKVTHVMQNIHEFMRTNYPNNFDFARMRIVELQAWFEKQKYTKMMRNLKNEWLQQIKKDTSNQIDSRKNSNGNKKKKIAHKDS